MPDIGNVLNDRYVVIKESQRSCDDIGEKEGSKVSNMSIAIDSRPAAIDSNPIAALARISDRNEPASKGVEYA